VTPRRRLRHLVEKAFHAGGVGIDEGAAVMWALGKPMGIELD
jgi:hypothetical protein